MTIITFLLMMSVKQHDNIQYNYYKRLMEKLDIPKLKYHGLQS